MKTIPQLRAHYSGLNDGLKLLKESVDLSVKISDNYTVGDCIENLQQNVNEIYKDAVTEQCEYLRYMLTGQRE